MKVGCADFSSPIRKGTLVTLLIRYRKRRPIRSRRVRGSRKTSDWQDGVGKGREALGRGVENTRSSLRCHLASLRFFPETPLRRCSPYSSARVSQSAVPPWWKGCEAPDDWQLGGLAYPHNASQTPPIPTTSRSPSSRQCISSPVALSFRLGAC